MIAYRRFVPRPITDRVYWEHVRTDPFYASWREVNEALVRTASDRPPQATASDYLRTRRHNDRSRLDHVNLHDRAVFVSLVVRRAMLGVDLADRDDRLLDWLWAMATDASWSLANHRSRGDLPEMGSRQFSLDLNSCEVAAFLAEFLEVMRPWIDAQSDTLAESLRTLIDERILTPFADGEPVWWEQPERINNWIGVCAGNILAACESLAAQGHPRPAARARALHDLRRYLDESFTQPHGECDEGVGYWSYGWSGASMGLSRLTAEELTAALDTDRLRAVADYPRRAHLYSDEFFASNDTPALVRPWLAVVPWLAAASGNRWLADWAASSQQPAKTERLLGMALRTLDAMEMQHAEGSHPASPASGGAGEFACMLPDQQAAILRVPTPAGEIVATIAGGHNDERHNHNDLGHFQIALAGSMLVPDLGAPWPYPADFFGPGRYGYLSAGSGGHNCPVIGGHEQREGREAAAQIIDWTPGGDRPRLALDLTAAYPPEAGLRRWTRQVEATRPEGCVTITDTLETAPPQPVKHVVWTLSPPVEEAPGDGSAWRAGLGDALVCEVSPAPDSTTVEEFQADDHDLKNFAGRALYRLSFKYGPVGERRVTTRFFVRANGSK